MMLWVMFGVVVFVVIESFRIGGSFSQILPQALPAPVRRAAATTTLAVAGAAIFLLGAAQGADLAGGPYSRRAHEQLQLAQTAAMSRFIKDTTGKQPQQLTVLTGTHAILVTEPYYGFLPLRARYAHPEARLPQRFGVLPAAA